MERQSFKAEEYRNFFSQRVMNLSNLQLQWVMKAKSLKIFKEAVEAFLKDP